MANDIERPAEDIFYDNNPFVAIYQCDCGRIKNHIGLACEFCNTVCRYIGDMNARYKGEVMNQLTRENFFNGVSEDYFDNLTNLIGVEPRLHYIFLHSNFLRKYITEILNRLCLECDFVREIEEHPERYTDYTKDDVYQPIYDFLDWLFNTCRFGKNTVEKFVDTVEQDIIDEFHELLASNAASLLIMYIYTHT